MKPRQTPTLALLAGLFLVSAGLKAAPCAASDTVMCLSAQRFGVDVRWRDFQGNSGSGHGVTVTPDTGYFWFFSESNVELVVKVLDARGFNGHFWVFFGALSNVEYTLTVTDSVTGATKTYQNPSGQFASVGDTAAFAVASTGVSPSHETVVAEGTQTPPESLEAIRRFVDAAAPAAGVGTKKAATLTPCPGPSTSLFLSNCRFELTVEWTDFQGRTGSGQAVQLTPDTGYFWFFSASNVELIIKVLDARGFNDRFWVFYGALSNVEYALHVKDTVSGALRIYRNPSGNFASVGDTAAFRGGYAVAVTADTGRAVSSVVSRVNGGTLSATAADGTVFTLEVPPNALVADTTITMTPVSSIDRFPFSGGLVAAVNLEPSGLHLMSGARLTIRTPSRIAQSEETTFAWSGNGEDFFLYPPVAAGGDLQMYVLRLGGYGVGRGTDAERQTQARREPPGEVDRLSHRMTPLLREGRAEARGGTAVHRVATPTDWRLGLTLLMDETYSPEGALRDRMERCFGYPDDVIGLVSEVTEWVVNVELNLGPLDSVFPGRRAEIRRLVEAMFLRALQIIHLRCVADVTEIRDLPRILGLAKFLRINLQTAAETALKCLSFRLSFESTIVTSQGSATSIASTVRATVPLRVQSANLSDPEQIYPKLKGEDLIVIENIQAGHMPAGCQVTVGPSESSTFKAELDLPVLDLFASTTLIALYYDIGQPRASLTVHDCQPSHAGDPPPPPFTVHSAWPDDYYICHESELDDTSGYLYHAYHWIATGDRDPWAFTEYTGGHPVYGTLLTEDTLMKLTHTPE